MTVNSTFGQEDHLPRVPLPTLEDSCDRFLAWCAPLLTPDELATTAAAVAEFRDGPGPRLHADLARYDADPAVDSWLDDFWATRYLGRRDRIALNANFFFLLKDSDPEDIVRAVRVVAEGESLLSPSVTRRVVETFAAGAAPAAPAVGGLDELTEREAEVVALVGTGLSNAEIAERLVISPATARTHVSRAMLKLGARDRAQLVVFAYEAGLVTPGRGAT